MRPLALRPLLLVLILISLGSGGCGSDRHIVNLHTVEEGVLLRAGQADAVGLAELRDTHGVRTVINLNHQTTNEELTDAMALGLDYVPLPMGAYTLEREKFITLLAAIRQAEAEGRTPVLVHCKHGQDRTGAAVAIYRVIELGWDADRAIDEMQDKRHWTHRLIIPHLDEIVADAAKNRQAWLDAVERRLPVEVIRPPVPYNRTTRPSGVPETLDVEPSSRPSILVIN